MRVEEGSRRSKFFLRSLGRDSTITFLFLNSILSEGEHRAIEAMLSKVLEKVIHEDRSVCCEKDIEDCAAT